MNKSIRLLMGLLTSAFMLAGGVASPAIAQDKGKDAKAAPAAKAEKAPTAKGTGSSKVLFENEKVRVTEARFKPGEGGASQERPARLTYQIQGGTFLRTYPDGKKEKIDARTGEWRWLEKGTYSFENVGKTEIIQHTVRFK
jgi:hypothetical protein